MADWGDEFSFVRGAHVKIYERSDISISIRSMNTKFDHSNKTIEADAGDFILSRWRGS